MTVYVRRQWVSWSSFLPSAEVDACCVGITWQARSIVCKKDVLWCCLGFGRRHRAYDAQRVSLARRRESKGWGMLLLL